MKILHLCAELSLAGGVESYLRRLTADQTGRGHEVTVMGGGGDARSWPPGTARAELVPGVHLRDAGPEVARRAVEAAGSFGPDVVHVHEIRNLELAGALADRWPVIKHAHVDFTCAVDGRRFFRRRRRACSRRLGPMCFWHYYAGPCGPAPSPLFALRGYRQARDAIATWSKMARVVVNSECLRASCRAAGLPDRLIEVLHYYVPDAEARPPAAAAGGGGRELLFVGRIAPEKGLEDLLEALARLGTETRLTVVGDGFARAAAEKRAGRLGLRDRVDFTGWRDDAESFYRKAAVLVVPSLWPEPFGIVGIEAMARAIPVVAYRSGGIPEWLEDGVTGTLVEPGDVRALAAAIERVLSDTELAGRMGRAGPERQRRVYSPGPHLERLERIYREAAGSSPKG